MSWVCRMKWYSSLPGGVLAIVMSAPGSTGPVVVQDLGATYEFLVSDRLIKGGALYSPAAYRTRHRYLPGQRTVLEGSRRGPGAVTQWTAAGRGHRLRLVWAHQICLSG